MRKLLAALLVALLVPSLAMGGERYGTTRSVTETINSRVYAAVGDTTPPAVPTSLGATAGDTQVSLSWSHSSPGDVDEYVVEYRCPSGSGSYTEDARPTTASEIVTGLTNGVECDFQVAAEDTANNRSAYTSAVQSTPTGETLVNGRPALLDLYATMDSRIPAVNAEEIEAFADARDTIAELEGLGWARANVGATCADDSTDDLTAIQTAINAAAENTVIVLNGSGSPCVYNGTLSLSLQKSNVIISGLGWGSTRIDWDRTSASGNYAPQTGVIAIHAPGSPAPGASLTWSSNFSIGTTVVVISDAVGTVTVGDRVVLKAQDASGNSTSWTSVVTAAGAASSTRSVTIEDPLPIELTSTGAALQRYGARNTAWIENSGLMHMEIDQTQSSRVTSYNDCESAVSGGVQTATCPFFRVPILSHQAVRHLRVEHVRFLNVFNSFISGSIAGGGNIQSDHAIIRSSRFDELYMTYYRANNNSSISFGSPDSNGTYSVNNVVGDRNNRFATIEAGGTGSVVAWNYQVTQSADDGTNTYCDVIATTGGLGRSIYWHGGGGNQSGAIVEGNDLHCHIEIDGNSSDLGRMNVLYRNRLVRASTNSGLGGHISNSGTNPFDKSTVLLNRVRTFDKRNGGEFLEGAGSELYIGYNAADVSCTLGMAVSAGGCTGTNGNPSAAYVGNVQSTSAVTVTASAAYPPSFLFSSPPSWWCQEACAWSDTVGPGAAEANSGGALCKTPAQILSEGGICTPL